MLLDLIVTTLLNLGTLVFAVLCGRYSITIDPRVLIQRFNAEMVDPIRNICNTLH